MARRRKRRNAPRRRRNAIHLSNPRRRRRRANPRRRRNTGMKLKMDMGSMLLGAAAAYYFHDQLAELVGRFLPAAAPAAPVLTVDEMAAINAQAEAEVAAEAELAGFGAIHLNRGRRGYGAIHLNPIHL